MLFAKIAFTGLGIAGIAAGLKKMIAPEAKVNPMTGEPVIPSLSDRAKGGALAAVGALVTYNALVR